MVNIQEIKRRRNELGLSMDQAAARSIMDGKPVLAGRQHWNDIEKGSNPNPTIKTMLGMAKALRCSIVKIVNQDHLKGRKT